LVKVSPESVLTKTKKKGGALCIPGRPSPLVFSRTFSVLVFSVDEVVGFHRSLLWSFLASMFQMVEVDAAMSLTCLLLLGGMVSPSLLGQRAWFQTPLLSEIFLPTLFGWSNV